MPARRGGRICFGAGYGPVRRAELSLRVGLAFVLAKRTTWGSRSITAGGCADATTGAVFHGDHECRFVAVEARHHAKPIPLVYARVK